MWNYSCRKSLRRVSDKLEFSQNIFCCYPPSHLTKIHFHVSTTAVYFLLPWQTQSCSYPWQILLQRLLSQLVTEVGDECWHHWLIRDRSWYFSEKWDVIGRKWIGLESKSKQFMCWSFVMEEEELVEGLEGEWHEQTSLALSFQHQCSFLEAPLQGHILWALQEPSFSEVSLAVLSAEIWQW